MAEAPSLAYHDFYKTNGSDTTVYFEGPSLTRQEFKDECDINTIMKRYEVAGAGVNGLPRDPNQIPMYVDWDNAPQTLMEYMARMDEAQAAFMTLPAIVRKEFENDPIQFVEFASDPENLDQMRSWGLAPPAKAPEAPEPVKVAPSSDPAPGAS